MEGIFLALFLFGFSFFLYLLRLMKSYIKSKMGGDKDGDGRNS